MRLLLIQKSNLNISTENYAFKRQTTWDTHRFVQVEYKYHKLGLDEIFKLLFSIF